MNTPKRYRITADCGFISNGRPTNIPHDTIIELEEILPPQPEVKDFEILSVSNPLGEGWSCDKKMFDWYIKNGWDINQVKIIGDGLVFTVGETVITNDGRGRHQINQFKIIDGYMCVGMDTFITKWEFLSKIKKLPSQPKALFTDDMGLIVKSPLPTTGAEYVPEKQQASKIIVEEDIKMVSQNNKPQPQESFWTDARVQQFCHKWWGQLNSFEEEVLKFKQSKSSPQECKSGESIRCPKCGAIEVDKMTPRTTYECGSSDYDQRPGTFKQSEKCLQSSPQPNPDEFLRNLAEDKLIRGEQPKERITIANIYQTQVRGNYASYEFCARLIPEERLSAIKQAIERVLNDEDSWTSLAASVDKYTD